jgi:hypothetical protein
MNIYLNGKKCPLVKEDIMAVKQHLNIDIKLNSTIICDQIAMMVAINKARNCFDLNDEECTQLLLLEQDNKNLYEIEFTNGTSIVINDVINKALITMNETTETTPELLDAVIRSVYNPWFKIPDEYNDVMDQVFDIIGYDAKIPSRNSTTKKKQSHQKEFFKMRNFRNSVINNSNMNERLTFNPTVTFNRDVVNTFTKPKIVRQMTDKLYFEDNKCHYILESDFIKKNNLTVMKTMIIKHDMSDDFTKYIKNFTVHGVNEEFGDYQLTDEEKQQVMINPLINLSGNAIFTLNNLMGNRPIKGYTSIDGFRDIRLYIGLRDHSKYSIHFELTVVDDCPIDYIKLFMDICGTKNVDELRRFNECQMDDVQMDIEERIVEGDNIGNISGVVERIAAIFIPDGSECPHYMLNNGEFTDDLWNMEIYNEKVEDDLSDDIIQNDNNEDDVIQDDVIQDDVIQDDVIQDDVAQNWIPINGIVMFNDGRDPTITAMEKAEENEIVYINKELCHDMISGIPNVPIYVKEFGVCSNYNLQPTGFKIMTDKTRYIIDAKVSGKTHILIFRRVIMQSFRYKLAPEIYGPNIYLNLCIDDHVQIKDKLKNQEFAPPPHEDIFLPQLALPDYQYDYRIKFDIPKTVRFRKLMNNEICPLSLVEIEDSDLYYLCGVCTAVMSQDMFENWHNENGNYSKHCPQCNTTTLPDKIYRNAHWSLSGVIKNISRVMVLITKEDITKPALNLFFRYQRSLLDITMVIGIIKLSYRL